MKKKIFKMKTRSLLILCVLLIFLSQGLAAQSSSVDRRITGTWVCPEMPDSMNSTEVTGVTWVLNANGTGTENGEPIKYAAIDGIMVIIGSKVFSSDSVTSTGMQYAISSDGRTMVVFFGFTIGFIFQKK